MPGLGPFTGRTQDVLMAKGNAQFTVSMSPVNLYGRAMSRQLKEVEGDYSKFEYSVKFSKPLSFTGEYALSNYTTIGVNINYFRFDLSELRQDALGTQTAATKGSHLDLNLRVLRYLLANARGAIYVLGEIGMRSRSIEYAGGLRTMAYINTFPETRKNDFDLFSYDYGVGVRARVVKQFGLAAEFTMLSPFGRYGVFYILQPAGRRSGDQIGW